MSTHFIITAEFVFKALIGLLLVSIAIIGMILGYIGNVKTKREEAKRVNKLPRIKVSLNDGTYKISNTKIKKINEKINFINRSNIDLIESEESRIKTKIEKTEELLSKFINGTSDVRKETKEIMSKALDDLLEELQKTGFEKGRIDEIKSIAEEVEK